MYRMKITGSDLQQHITLIKVAQWDVIYDALLNARPGVEDIPVWVDSSEADNA